MNSSLSHYTVINKGKFLIMQCMIMDNHEGLVVFVGIQLFSHDLGYAESL